MNRISFVFFLVVFNLLALETASASEANGQDFISRYVAPLLKGRENFYRATQKKTDDGSLLVTINSQSQGLSLGRYEINLSPNQTEWPTSTPELQMRWMKSRAQDYLGITSVLRLPAKLTQDPTPFLRSMLRSDFLLHPMMTPPGNDPRLEALQQNIVREIRDLGVAATKKGDPTRALVVLPPGVGKTVIAGKFADEETLAGRKDFRIFFIVQNREILDEAAAKLQRLMQLRSTQVRKVYGEESRQDMFAPGAKLIVASRTAFHRQHADYGKWRDKFDGRVMVFLDEAQHIGKVGGEFHAIINEIEESSFVGDVILGLSATPWHLESDIIEKVFKNNVVTAFLSPEEKAIFLEKRQLIFMARLMLFRAMAQGYLSPLSSYHQVRYVEESEESDTPVLTSRYLRDWSLKYEDVSEKERLELLKRDIKIHIPVVRQILREIRNNFRKDADGRLITPNRGVIFVPSISHANVYSYLLNHRGGKASKDPVESRVLHSGLSQDERDKNMDWFRDQEKKDSSQGRVAKQQTSEKPIHKYLFAIRALGEGVDEPRINHLVLAKPYSKDDMVGMLELIQNLGRGSRISYGKSDFRVSDFTGDMRRLLFEGMDQTLISGLFTADGEMDFEPFEKPIKSSKVAHEIEIEAHDLKDEKFKTEEVVVPPMVPYLGFGLPTTTLETPQSTPSRLTVEESGKTWGAYLDGEKSFWDIIVSIYGSRGKAPLIARVVGLSGRMLLDYEKLQTSKLSQAKEFDKKLRKVFKEIPDEKIIETMERIADWPFPVKPGEEYDVLKLLIAEVERLAQEDRLNDIQQRKLEAEQAEKKLSPDDLEFVTWREFFESPVSTREFLKTSSFERNHYKSAINTILEKWPRLIDFIKVTDSELSDVQGVGPGSLSRIKSRLKTAGLVNYERTSEGVRVAMSKRSPYRRFQLNPQAPASLEAKYNLPIFMEEFRPEATPADLEFFERQHDRNPAFKKMRVEDFLKSESVWFLTVKQSSLPKEKLEVLTSAGIRNLRAALAHYWDSTSVFFKNTTIAELLPDLIVDKVVLSNIHMSYRELPIRRIDLDLLGNRERGRFKYDIDDELGFYEFQFIESLGAKASILENARNLLSESVRDIVKKKDKLKADIELQLQGQTWSNLLGARYQYGALFRAIDFRRIDFDVLHRKYPTPMDLLTVPSTLLLEINRFGQANLQKFIDFRMEVFGTNDPVEIKKMLAGIADVKTDVGIGERVEAKLSGEYYINRDPEIVELQKEAKRRQIELVPALKAALRGEDHPQESLPIQIKTGNVTEFLTWSEAFESPSVFNQFLNSAKYPQGSFDKVLPEQTLKSLVTLSDSQLLSAFTRSAPDAWANNWKNMARVAEALEAWGLRLDMKLDQVKPELMSAPSPATRVSQDNVVVTDVAAFAKGAAKITADCESMLKSKE